MPAASGPEMLKVFQAMDAARKMVMPTTMVPQWNEAVGLVISGKAAANVMGDWAGGEFQVANMVAGKDYDCLPGLGVDASAEYRWRRVLLPEECRSGSDHGAARMASMLVQGSPGCLQPEKGLAAHAADVDLSAANDCMKKGLAILADPTKVFPNDVQMIDRDSLNQIRDLFNNFFSDKSVTPEAALAQFADVIKNAPPL